MERIKLALEKAREERKKAGNSPIPTIAPRDSKMPPTSTVYSAVPDKIVYQQTQSIDVEKQILRDKRIISGFEPGPFIDSYKVLRTQILQKFSANHWTTLAVTSAGENEGKTLTAINLAISIAMEINNTVLLVDADLRHPSVLNIFDIKSETGLSDYLTDDKPLSEMLINPAGIERFSILPGGTPLENSSEMLNSPKMQNLVNELRERYPSRIVIFDLPPILSASDALAFAPYVDASLLVVEEGKTTIDELNRANKLLVNNNLIGTILNKAHISGLQKLDSTLYAQKH